MVHYGCDTVQGMETPNRSIRISDDIWQAAQAKAEEVGVTVTDVIKIALVEYGRTGTIGGKRIVTPQTPLLDLERRVAALEAQRDV